MARSRRRQPDPMRWKIPASGADTSSSGRPRKHQVDVRDKDDATVGESECEGRGDRCGDDRLFILASRFVRLLFAFFTRRKGEYSGGETSGDDK